MNMVVLADVTSKLESGARPKGGVGTEGDVPSLGGEHLNDDGGFNLDSPKRVTDAFFNSLRGGRIKRYDILVVKDGATTGRTCFVSDDFPFKRAAVNEHVFRLAVDDVKAHPKYVFHFLRSPIGRAAIMSDFRGATVGGISRGFTNKVRLPLPSIHEQRRIAAILDHADALRAKRRQVLAHLDSLPQSIFVDMFGDPVANARGWPTVPLSNLGKLDRGVSKHRPRNDPALLGGTHPLIQTGDVANSGGYIASYKSTYSDLGLAQSKLWPAGTLCITIAANIAKTGILTFDACFPDSVVGFASDPATTSYIQVWLGFLQATLEASAPQSAQRNINLAVLRSLRVPFPDAELVSKFAASVEGVRDASAAELKALRDDDELFASLQSRAFRGEL